MARAVRQSPDRDIVLIVDRSRRRRRLALAGLRYSRSAMSRRIAIVEDEPAIRANYATRCEARLRGGRVRQRGDALGAFRTRLPDLALIDIGLGDDIDGGFALCRELRALSAALPIIFLSARDSEFDIVAGLRAGRRRLPDQGREPAAPARRASPRCSAAATCSRAPRPPRT